MARVGNYDGAKSEGTAGLEPCARDQEREELIYRSQDSGFAGFCSGERREGTLDNTGSERQMADQGTCLDEFCRVSG